MGLAVKAVLALGIDGLAQWVIRVLVTFVVVSVAVVLIVVQTAATVLTGGEADHAAAPASTPIAVSPGAVQVPSAAPTLNVGLDSQIIQFAQAWLGVPYLFGGCSRSGVDCSCLVQNVYAAVGIHLPRVAVDQFNATTSISDPQPGDLVFFANTYTPGISHVGIYIGNGLQINAPTTGQVVSAAPVFTGYWGAHYAGAHRVRG